MLAGPRHFFLIKSARPFSLKTSDVLGVVPDKHPDFSKSKGTGGEVHGTRPNGRLTSIRRLSWRPARPRNQTDTHILTYIHTYTLKETNEERKNKH